MKEKGGEEGIYKFYLSSVFIGGQLREGKKGGRKQNLQQESVNVNCLLKY